MDYYGITHTGKVRRQNQDVFKIEYSQHYQTAVLVVCDGMGGARAGNVASSMAAEIFTESVSEKFDTFNDLDSVKDAVLKAVKKANEQIYRRSIEDDNCQGMGTTLVALIVSPAGFLIVNIGDSRAYHVCH
ncbi:MAG: serine/threonine-protein phosphatase, partial [Oscillospiraceae bacterium]|nr:serine/threonine-protein phosphatase [Oscillospiraceae bacterium]